jgi:hypothetical protein
MTPWRLRISTVILGAIAFAFFFTSAHVGIGGTRREFLVAALILLPAAILFAYLAWRTTRRGP